MFSLKNYEMKTEKLKEKFFGKLLDEAILPKEEKKESTTEDYVPKPINSEGHVPAPIKKRKWHLLELMIERSKKLHENQCDVEKAD